MHKFWSNPIYCYLFFSFVACTFGGIFKKSLLNPRSWRFTSMFPSKSFILLAPTFKCLTHFGLLFCMWYEMQVQIYSFSCSYPVPQHHLWLSCMCVCVWLSFKLGRKKEDVKTKKYINFFFTFICYYFYQCSLFLHGDLRY